MKFTVEAFCNKDKALNDFTIKLFQITLENPKYGL